MHIFHQRPLALAACLYAFFAILSTVLSESLHLISLIVFGCLFIGILSFSILKRHFGKRKIVASLCLFAVVLSLATSYGFFKIRYADLQKEVGKVCDAEGVVIERLSGDAYYSRFRVKIDRWNGEERSFGAQLDCEYPSSLQVGDRFELTTVPRKFESNEYFDEESYSISEGCMLVLVSSESADCTVKVTDTSSLSVMASKTNLKLSYDLYQATKGAGLAPRLLLGNGTFLSPIDQLRFSYTGVSHLLALSGLHVSILIGFLEFILRRFRLPRMARAVLIPLASIGYLILTGCPVSAVRAVIMICILYVAYLWRGEYDSFTALSLALVLILQITPYAVYDLSMWLSFTAAGAIIIFMPLIQRLIEAWREKTRLPRPVFRCLCAVISAISIGLIVNVALLPLVAVIFGEVSLWSVPVTLLFSIPVTLILILGMLLLVFPFVPYLGTLCGAIESWMLETMKNFSELENGLLPLEDFRCGIVLLLLAGILILLAVLPVKRKLWWLMVPVLCVAVVGSSVLGIYAPSRREWNYHALEHPKGEISVYTKEGQAVVVNQTLGAVNLSYEIKSIVREEMCTEIDALIYDELNGQSAYFLCKLSERIFVRSLHLPTPKNAYEAALADRICIDAERYGIRVLFDSEEVIEKIEQEKK